MPTVHLSYNDRNMRSPRTASHGVTHAEWKAIVPKLRLAKKAVQSISQKGEQGFLKLPFEKTHARASSDLAALISKQCSDLVVLGTGGSDLGARAIQQAIVNQGRKGVRVHFGGSSTDPDALTELMKSINPKKTCVNVISKSGGTLETMTSFLVFRDLLKKRNGKKFVSRIIATTDPEDGALNHLATKEGYHILPVPQNVGGRFSVLSAVGLFPSAAMGVDVSALLSGARSAVERFGAVSAAESAPCRYAALHTIGMQRRNQRIHVFMPYSSRLEQFTRWVRQLVAESLGKKTARDGKVVHEGPTPVAAVGPEDQHSQLQLYTEGPFDKLITFLSIQKFNQDIKTPETHGLHEAIDAFGERSFTTLMHLEQSATAESLRRNKRPNGTIEIKSLNAAALGELFLFFEISVALMGELLNVNAYNQPGVELSKSLMKAEL